MKTKYLIITFEDLYGMYTNRDVEIELALFSGLKSPKCIVAGERILTMLKYFFITNIELSDETMMYLGYSGFWISWKDKTFFVPLHKDLMELHREVLGVVAAKTKCISYECVDKIMMKLQELVK